MLVLVGFVLGRRRRWLLVLGLAGLILLALCTRVGDITAWHAVFLWMPGAQAIRAVTRASLVIWIPASLSVAVVVDWLRAAAPKPALGAVIAAGVGLFCLAEQAKYLPWFDKEWNRAVIRQITSRVDPKACDTFFYSAVGPSFHPWKYSIDAMFASLESGVPTINGYSGSNPPAWGLGACTVRASGDEQRLDAALARWVERNQLDPARVCSVRLLAPGETARQR